MKQINFSIKLILSFSLLTMVFSTSCKKYLDERPDKSLVVPRSVKELQGILDAIELYTQYPIGGELGSDNFFVPYSNWSSGNIIFRNNYVWDANSDLSDDWAYAYTRIFKTNVVLDAIKKLDYNSGTQDEFNNATGSALFYRAFNFFGMSQLFAPQYASNSTSSGYGIPLRTTPDIEEKTKRSTVQQTYDQIISDLKEAAQLLPVTPLYKTRPSKPAAFALLARTYLVMQDYQNSLKYADSCIQLFSNLLDYNTDINTGNSRPFSVFGPLNNPEVIFYAQSRTTIFHFQGRADTVLFGSYDQNDLRKAAFFNVGGDGRAAFKGNYDGAFSFLLFFGLATDEVYLTRAECKARLSDIAGAMSDLNKLMSKRWKSGFFTPFTATSASDALSKVLTERRKELVFRGGLRWSDLRRLNLDNNYAVTLKRDLNGQLYTLAPNDLRYTFLVPPSVVNIAGIAQNLR